MRVIYLNIEHGEREKKIIDFLTSESGRTDIFCLEEIDKPIFDKVQSKLKEFDGYWYEKEVPEVDNYFLATFVRKKYKVARWGKILSNNVHIGAAAGFELSALTCNIEVAIVHGKSQPADKLDNPGRIKQSEEIVNFLSRVKLPRIIGGDFNLMPGTKSVGIFEQAGYKNLIKEFKIKSTRSKDAWKKALANFKKTGAPYMGKQLFADYLFVSPEIKVKDFKVPSIEVSDHLPLILDFEID